MIDDARKRRALGCRLYRGVSGGLLDCPQRGYRRWVLPRDKRSYNPLSYLGIIVINQGDKGVGYTRLSWEMWAHHIDGGTANRA